MMNPSSDAIPHGSAEPQGSMDIFSPRHEVSTSDIGIGHDLNVDLELDDVRGGESSHGETIIDYSGFNVRNILDGLQGKGPLASKRTILIGVPIMVALLCVIITLVLVLVIYPFANPPSDDGDSDSADRAPDHFIVDVVTSIQAPGGSSSFQLDITRSDSPIGVDHFYELVKAQYFDNNGIFRVVPNFVIQFGINGNPAVSALWNQSIADDPVVKSNVRGTISYATSGPNSRTTQLFINLGDNAFLDKRGFSPFGVVLADGMAVVNLTNAHYVEQPNQTRIYKQGNDYLNSLFPNLSYILSMRVVSES